jgi:hypothetical protein
MVIGDWNGDSGLDDKHNDVNSMVVIKIMKMTHYKDNDNSRLIMYKAV